MKFGMAEDPRICFMGFAPDPVAAMSAVDAVAMPSRWESYGLVAIEALSSGRTLLVSAVDGLTDHVPLGANVVQSSSVRSWNNALDKLIAGDLTLVTPEQDLEKDVLEKRFEKKWQKLLAALNPCVTVNCKPVQADKASA